MPIITVEAGKMNREKKAQMVKELTETVSKILDIPVDAFTVSLKENDPDNIGVGGRLLSDVLAEES